VSFLDESDDPPRRGGARRPPRRPTGPADRQQLMLRRALAIAVGVAILLILVFAVRACRGAAQEQAFKDYNRDVGAFVQESEDQAKGLFDVLERGGQSPVELQNTLNGQAAEAAQLVDRAKGTDHPGELDDAHRYLVETLEFRRDGLQGIANELPRALGDRGEEAQRNIAAQMQNFLTSDVIYQQRFLPRLDKGLRDEGLRDTEDPPESSFLEDIEWLVPGTVSDRIGRIASGEGGESDEGPVEPGLHGTGLGTVTAQPGGTQLSDGGATEIKAAPNLSLDVQVANQGEHDEQNVTVNVAIRGAGNPIELEEQLREIAAGQTQTVSVPLSSTPPTGQPVTIVVAIEKVPGEETADNNRGEFPVVFTR
jgi:hypothetical protein